MKKLIFIVLIVLLSGCFGSEKFDATNLSTVKKSTQSMMDSLSNEQLKEYEKAIEYFSVGGTDTWKSLIMIAASEDEMEAMKIRNLGLIDGLNTLEILEKYKVSLEQDRIEKRTALRF
jgi:hypothetical protein